MHLTTIGFVAALLVLPLASHAFQSNAPQPANAQPAATVRFTDVTEESGVRFKHVSTPEKRYIVESMSGGVALLDYDNDGYLDIYF
ncbi:MAG TPA: hypothetical protein VGB76_20250, partial [Pyrinomonadaceae bacterium]